MRGVFQNSSRAKSKKISNCRGRFEIFGPPLPLRSSIHEKRIHVVRVHVFKYFIGTKSKSSLWEKLYYIFPKKNILSHQILKYKRAWKIKTKFLHYCIILLSGWKNTKKETLVKEILYAPISNTCINKEKMPTMEDMDMKIQVVHEGSLLYPSSHTKVW